MPNNPPKNDTPDKVLVEALRPFARAAKWWSAFSDQQRITPLHDHGDCLEVGHLRQAEAALASNSPVVGEDDDELERAEQLASWREAKRRVRDATLPLIRPIPTDTADRYFITKGGAYYRPNAQGYTRDTAEAGRFTLEEAISRSHPNGPDGPRDGIRYELAPKATNTADRREAVAREIIARVVDRCRKLDDYANRRAWEKILSEEIQASLIAGPLPEGFVAVPVEPTEAMLTEAVDNVGPIGCCNHTPDTARETWSAMLAAATPPSVGEGGGA